MLYSVDKCYLFLSAILFQKTFDLVTAWCRDTGITDKIVGDTVATAVQGKGNNNYENVHSNQALTMMHLATSAIVFGVGLLLASIAFCCEVASHKLNKKKDMQERKGHHEGLEFPELI